MQPNILNKIQISLKAIKTSQENTLILISGVILLLQVADGVRCTFAQILVNVWWTMKGKQLFNTCMYRGKHVVFGEP